MRCAWRWRATGLGLGRITLPSRFLAICIAAVLLLCVAATPCRAQENPLNEVHTPAPPPPAKTTTDKKILTGPNAVRDATSTPGATIRVNVNLVLVPLTVTDPLDRLVTGLQRENFQLFDDGVQQNIKDFSTQDAPISIGIIFDLSASMASKFDRARKALNAFLRTCNPEDEFFVVGFNDRPSVIVDYTSDVDAVEARMIMLRPEKRTALIDAMYLGVSMLKQARYDRRALLVISDGGDNRSRYTEGELLREVRESQVQIYSIGIFDMYAPTDEEQNGPILLKDISETSGGRLFKVLDFADLTDIAQRISEELRNEYVLGYTPTDTKRNAAWRKLRVRLLPPPGLPPLEVHSREGYYAPSQ